MGHFSMKCAVTNLPVLDSDDVVVLFGEKFNGKYRGGDTGGFVMQHHFFSLLTPPLFGKYDGYGWIQDIEPESARFVNDVLGKFKDDNEETFNAETEMSWDDMVSFMTNCVSKNFDHTFIHRRVWDEMVAAAKGNFRDGIHSYSHDPNKKDWQDKLNQTFERAGCKVGQYNIYGHPEELFNGALLTWASDLVDHTNGLQELYREFGKEFVDQIKSDFENGDLDAVNIQGDVNTKLKVANALTKILLDTWKRVNQRRTVSAISYNFAGFFYYRENIQRLDELLEVSTTPERMAILRNTQLMFIALMNCGIVVRGVSDMPSEFQDGAPYWPFVAVIKGMQGVLQTRALDRCENVENLTHKDQLSILANDGLDESYEF